MDVQQPPVLSLAYIALHPDAAGIAISAVLAIASWVVNAKLARNLQRKQLGIEIIFKYLGDEAFTKHLQNVYRKFNSDHTYDWQTLAKKRYDKVPYQVGEEELSDSLCRVLNHFESLAIATLNEAADNDILRWSQRSIVIKISTEVKPFIDQTRKTLNAPHSWCNFEELAEKWKKEDKDKSTAKKKK